MEFLNNLATGFGVALTPANLGFALAGALIGTLIGVLPGIGPIATIAMLLPLTFHLEPVSGLIMLAGIFYGAQYGGSTTAILVQGLREKDAPPERTGWQQLMPIVVVTTSLVAFAFAIEQLGLVLSILLLVGIGAIAARDIGIWETLVAALVLVGLSWVIFILGLGLTIPVWPVW